MLTRKQIGVMYGIEKKLVTKLLRKAGLISDNAKGKGKRPLITPIEFEIFRQKFGDPIRIKTSP